MRLVLRAMVCALALSACKPATSIPAPVSGSNAQGNGTRDGRSDSAPTSTAVGNASDANDASVTPTADDAANSALCAKVKDPGTAQSVVYSDIPFLVGSVKANFGSQRADGTPALYKLSLTVDSPDRGSDLLLWWKPVKYADDPVIGKVYKQDDGLNRVDLRTPKNAAGFDPYWGFGAIVSIKYLRVPKAQNDVFAAQVAAVFRENGADGLPGENAPKHCIKAFLTAAVQTGPNTPDAP